MTFFLDFLHVLSACFALWFVLLGMFTVCSFVAGMLCPEREPGEPRRIVR